ncbi:hypothetical protein L1049_008789 [Liquidambar formosana]|uniref:J domain-containing protein n=1 Tax=Liquidambar formosana TaxID=63359 RepID=A0AAP0X5W1_LIQFO
MNSAMKAAQINPQVNCMHLRVALFHATPALDRRRRTHWDSRFNNYAKKTRKLNAKQTLLRNVSAYAEHLFQNWQSDFDQDDPSSSRGTSWFKKQYGANGSRRDWTGSQGPQPRGRRGFQFSEDDFDVETIFRSAFGGNRYFYWSFINEENPHWRSSSGYSSNYRTSWNWRGRIEDEYDSSTESDSSELDLASHRVALGLSASGPLKLEEVKNAYRVCALKWHPDRHQGSSKAVAEEKFKLCSAAYQSLCDKLVLD